MLLCPQMEGESSLKLSECILMIFVICSEVKQLISIIFKHLAK